MNRLKMHIELRKIEKGIRLAHKRMVKEKIKNDEYVVVCINDKIVRKKAKEVYRDIYPDLFK